MTVLLFAFLFMREPWTDAQFKVFASTNAGGTNGFRYLGANAMEKRIVGYWFRTETARTNFMRTNK